MATDRASASRPRAGLCIAIVGAESTGKTTLARELTAALAESPAGAPRRVALVEEVLRDWCNAHGRTPRPGEQQGILVEQHRRIEAAAATHDIVVSDTTGLMTHVYSDLLFDDRSLEALAVERHRTMTATLLTALDLPWVPDRGIRDGAHVRVPVDDRLRALLARHALPFAVVSGHGPTRLAQAQAALQAFPALRALRPDATPRSGLFSDLLTAIPATPATARRAWICDCCVPEAEQALRMTTLRGRGG